MPQCKYHAFISYSHADRRWADWLHKALETYLIPQRLVGRTTAAGTIPKRFAPVFRDRDELPSATDLDRKVNEALAQSAALVVICSPHSASSRWVDAEVREFKRLGREQRVFCLIVDGEPNAGDIPGREHEECFAPALRHRIGADGGSMPGRTEPIAADARPGKDGKANAKLKLLSGLLDVGFDELRQREQQRAHRKLAWVAGLSLVGMLATSGLAAFALHARNQAQFQREQAENLIGFMLGNLKDKLDEVNRLDILDEVADHVMGYWDAQGPGASVEGSGKRAKALLMIGQVRLAQGRMDDAGRAFAESLDIARATAARQPGNPDLQMAVVDAYSFQGLNEWQRGDIDAALARFDKALPIVARVVHAHPRNGDWQERLMWAYNNRGHLREVRGQFEQALGDYVSVQRVAQALVERQPGNAKYKQRLADTYDSLGQLLYKQGNLAGAERYYAAERALLRTLLADDPRNNVTRAYLAAADTFYAHVAGSRGQLDEARESLQRAHDVGSAMLAESPGDVDLAGDLASYCRRLARVMRLQGDRVAARRMLARATTLYGDIVARAPDGVRGRLGKAATLLESAQLEWQEGHRARAAGLAAGARSQYAALLQERPDSRDASLGLASALLLLGKLDAHLGRPAAAADAWNRSLDALRVYGDDSRDPEQLSVRAELLQLLGRTTEARVLVSRLDAAGYRDPAFLEWAAAGIRPRPAATPTNGNR
ncbi:TIR domain-containing protein [Luteimonas sp. 50]|uniref:TIR domain-containing protein n=1 Tax=Cognatiluteimonas sedimenti TaxID=2927791 RepID=A0ABT0A4A4_9GAMM|nr:toll/interleukin-1 receptor domain-containing protein [Lysobacter sedimenti]MCJ0825810.1 TIR domain-containing protein [Lysobacter sedimenti]